jgi:hypothetical protein
MARRSQHSFIKRQKELERKQKAEKKRARRQGKKQQDVEVEVKEAREAPPGEGEE